MDDAKNPLPLFMVERETCIGCGECVAIAPAHFSMDMTLKAICHTNPATPDEVVLVQKAVDACPVYCIDIVSV